MTEIPYICRMTSPAGSTVMPPALRAQLRQQTVGSSAGLRARLLERSVEDGPRWARRDRDRAAMLLHHLHSPAEVLQLTLDHLVDTVGAARGDAGFLGKDDRSYVPHAVIADETATRKITETPLPNHHPVLQAAWRSADPMSISRVRGNKTLGTLEPVFCGLSASAMLATAIRHGSFGLGLVCLDETDCQRTWSAQSIERVRYFLDEWAAPVLHTALLLEATREVGLLTPAELRTVRLLAQGWSYAENAAHLDRSVHTVDNQLRSARSKTGARNSVDLLRLVGLLDVPLC